MPTIQLPLMKGSRKNPYVADYVDLLPVNMLAVQKEILNAGGYMRSFPGISKGADVNGIARGAEYNTKDNKVYRVSGGKLYSSGEELVDIPGSGRVSMEHSYNSQGVAANGKLLLYGYDSKELKTLDNWPERDVTQKGYEKTLSRWTHEPNGRDAFYVPDEAQKGKIVVTLTPVDAKGVSGESISITEEQWGTEKAQEKPEDDKPWLTHIKITGAKTNGSVVYITWWYKDKDPEDGASTDDVTTVSVDLHVEEVAIDYAQYDIGRVKDICQNRSRYVWVKEGGDTFGVTDLEDESHPDRYRPFYRAESQPDGIIGVSSWRDLVVCFGSRTIEYFSLTGSSSATDPIYIAQPSLMVNIGIAGTHCQCEYGESFAVLSHPASGMPSVYVVDSGSKTAIATATVEKILSEYSADELAGAVMESVRFEAHELLIIHLARHVLCFDGSVSANGPQWCLLKSGLYSDTYRGIDFIHDGSGLTVGDKREGTTGRLNFSLSSQYDDAAELLLFTPMLKADNANLFDFEIESAAGLAQRAEKLFLSATTDGSNYGHEQLIKSDDTYRYDARVLLRRVGRCRKNIGFRIRLVTKTPTSLTLCQLRVGDG